MQHQAYLNSTTHTIAWFFKAYQDNDLELNPPFQRNPVWTEKQKSYLIDTILNGYPIPELYMQEYSSASGKERHVVVDGQQRIRACLEFIEGKFLLTETDTMAWKNLSFDELTKEQKKKIYGYQFEIRLLPEMPEQQIRAMFTRLNRNVVALNMQELRHATYWGPFIKTMEKIADEDIWSSFDIFTPNDIRRMIDVEFISELAIGNLHGIQHKKDSLDKWYSAYEEEFDSQAEIEEMFRRVTGEINQLFPDIHKTRWRKKSDFYTLFVYFSHLSDKFPLSSDLRKEVGDKLKKFGEKVTDRLRMEDVNEADDAVAIYANNVARAASGLQNRKLREQALKDMLDNILV